MTTTLFTIGYDTDTNDGINGDCYSDIPDPTRAEEYLLIPGAEVQTVPILRASHFCKSSLTATIAYSSLPGPFVMYFKSDQIYDVAKQEIGFRISYEVL